jgi:hypothetical protein
MQLATYNIQTKEITGLWYVPKISDEMAHWIKPTQLAQSGSSCLFIHSYCDTIFQIDDEGFAPKYKVIFSEKYKDYPKPIEEYMDQNIINGIEDIKQMPNQIMIGYMHEGYLRSAIYDKATGLCNVHTALTYSGMDSLKMYQNTTFFHDNNIMTSTFYADTFLDSYGKETDRAKIQNESYRKKIESIVSSIDEYSNHVVIRFKIKPDSKL